MKIILNIVGCRLRKLLRAYVLSPREDEHDSDASDNPMKRAGCKRAYAQYSGNLYPQPPTLVGAVAHAFTHRTEH